MADYNNIPSGLRVQTQIPLDAKINVLNESTLSNLGESNNLAYTYHDKIVVTCLQEGTTWIWKQVEAGKENTGLIPIDFVYPFGIIAYGIDYSNKKYNFFRVNYLNVSDQKNYDAASLGDGQSIYKDKTTSGNNITFNFKEISTASAGVNGIPVLSSVTTVGDNVLINGKTLKTNNLSITEAAGEILIDSPTDPSDVKFYVNENYTGGNSNGSLSKPFNNLKAAFTAFTGTSTSSASAIITPQYANIGTIELLSNVTVPETGTTSMSYLSVNNLKLKGNGYRITYEGTQNEFISTKYLLDLCPKTTLQRLDYGISMSFEDVIIESKSVHRIVYHLNYKSPDSNSSQNSSSISFKNCEINDSAYTKETAAYANTGVILFGSPVYVQNTLDKDKYMVKNENINWYGEGGFTMENCKLNGSSSTILYNKNSSMSIYDIQMNFNPYYSNYQTVTAGVYTPMNGISFIYNYNDGTGTLTNGRRTESYIRIQNFKEQSQEATSGGYVIGGADCFYKGDGKSYFEIKDGSFYGEQVNNLIQLNSINSVVRLIGLDCSLLYVADTTYGVFKYINLTTPLSRIFIDVNQSVIPSVKYNVNLLYILPSASSAIINGADFTNSTTYASNSDAINIGKLIPGNIYYTAANVATRVI